MNTVIDITIQNPYSPALLILGVVSAALVIITVAAYFVVWDESLFALLIFPAGIFLFGAVIILSADTDAQTDRLTVELEELGYDHIQVTGQNIVAEAPDGSFVEGVVSHPTTETYTIYFR